MTDDGVGTTRDDRPDLFEPIATYARTPYACAFEVTGAGTIRRRRTRLAWSHRPTALLTELRGSATRDAGGAHRNLPVRELRLALQAKCPEAEFVDADAAVADAPDAQRRDVLAAPPETDPSARAGAAARLWSRSALVDWVRRVGADEGVLEAFTQEVEKGPFEAREDDLRIDPDTDRFEDVADALLALAAARVEGAEPFPGLGPVRRVIRSTVRPRTVEFETFPAEAKGALYSMVLTLSVETRPSPRTPYLAVSASRRRWMNRLPPPARLRGARTITAHAMSPREPRTAVTFPLGISREGIEAPENPRFLEQALEWGIAPPAAAADLARSAAAPDESFVGIPHASPHGSHPLGHGVSEGDVRTAVDVLAERFADLGWRRTRPHDLGKPAPAPRDHFGVVELEEQLLDFALANGRNDRDALDEDLADFLAAADGGGAAVRASKVPAEPEKLRAVQAANASKLDRAFLDGTFDLVVAAAGEADGERVRNVAERLAPGRVRVHRKVLPADAHGPRRGLPEASAGPEARFAARVEAWRPLAEEIGAELPRARVLVQAAALHDDGEDDRVNKPAGRHALARFAGANVQYLRPPGKRCDAFAEWIVRLQMAIYDLVFGHSGLAADVTPHVAHAFPRPETRPRAIYGLLCVQTARTRAGAKAREVAVALRTNPASGLVEGRACRFRRAATWTAWTPLADLLVELASWTDAGLGPDRATRSDTFRKFGSTVLDEVSERDGEALVLVDARSARRYWPWLSDHEIGSTPIELDETPTDPTRRWPGLRLVRVRDATAPPLLMDVSGRHRRIDADGAARETVDLGYTTVTPRIVRFGDADAAHHWLTTGFPKTHQKPRGISVYRSVRRTVSADKAVAASDPRRGNRRKALTEAPPDHDERGLPATLEVTVAHRRPDDAPDAIAHLVQGLRSGLAHTDETVALPAPLFFRTKILDYLCPHGSDEGDPEAHGTVDADTAPGPSFKAEGARVHDGETDAEHGRAPARENGDGREDEPGEEPPTAETIPAGLPRLLEARRRRLGKSRRDPLSASASPSALGVETPRRPHRNRTSRGRHHERHERCRARHRTRHEGRHHTSHRK